MGYCYIDNYEEAMETLEDVRKSLLAALVDRKVSKYVASYDGICGKLEKDRYLIIIRKKALRAMQEERFPITEDVKTVKVGNEMAITISVGDMTRTLRQKGVFDTNDNFTALSYTLFKSRYEISAQGLSSVFETMKDDIEDNSSAITQQADAISLRVTKTALKQTAGIDIDANTVRLTGQITANDNVHIEPNGSITAKNGAFDGLLKNEFKFLSATRVNHLEIEGYWYVITRFADKLRYSNVYLNPITQPHAVSYLDLPQDAYGAQFLIYNKDEYSVELKNYGTEPLIGTNVIQGKKAKRCTCVGNTTEGFKGYIFEDIV